jgi:hypothetical protein
MIEFRRIDQRNGIGRHDQFASVRRALGRLEMPADDGAFDDLLLALCDVDWPASALQDPARRAA